MTESQELLAQYVADGSEEAFRELVERYMNLVYSTAVRLVDGDAHRAQDVTQEVFLDLARLARGLSSRVMLGGWLHRHTCFVAAMVLRRERRRQHRERQAAEMHTLEDHGKARFEQIAPLLDEAINQLSTPDRSAIVLRFYEGQDLRSIGQALALNEDAAQKRVARALEKLRRLLLRRGVALSGAGLAAMLGAEASTAAPAGLAASVSSAALAGAAAGKGALALTTLKVISSMTKVKIATGTIVVACLGTAVVLEQQSVAALRAQNRALEQQVAQLGQVPGPSAADPQTAPDDPASRREEQLRELNRLRNQVGALRQQSGALAGLRARNHALHLATGKPEDPVGPAEAEFKEQTEMRMNHVKQWGLSFKLYALDHNEQFPTSFEQSARGTSTESELGFGTNNLEILYQGAEVTGADADKTLLFRDKETRRSPNGDLVRVYGFADGHTEAHAEPDEAGFAAWEADRIVATPPGTNTYPTHL
jgi:RNA polymerase sigma factor (sigma-70 family)